MEWMWVHKLKLNHNKVEVLGNLSLGKFLDLGLLLDVQVVDVARTGVDIANLG